MVIRMRIAWVVIGMILVMAVGGLASATTKATNPQITILPDTILNPNEQELVVGTGWSPNGTVRIDLIMPDGSTLEGVVSGQVNASGGFKLSFTAPNQYGYGYVRAVEGSLEVSKQVFFNGYTGGGELTITWTPTTIYTNETVEFSVEASFLSSRNYVLDATVFYPNMEVIYYAVLHNGIGIVDMSFNKAGVYYVKFSVEETPYNKTVQIQVQQGQAPSTGNYTITVTPAQGSLKGTILVLDGNGNPVSGVMKIINPDGTMQVVSIMNGYGNMNFVSVGNYILQFKDNRTGKTATKSYNYEPKITMQISQFNSNAEATFTLYINNIPYTGDATATLTEPDGTTTVLQITNGQGVIKASDSGTYSISVNVLGENIQGSATFQDTPEIDNIQIYQSSNTLIITGYIYGHISGKPLPNQKVTVESWTLVSGYGSATTDNTGFFTIRIPLSSSDNGEQMITISVGSTQIQKSVYIQGVSGGSDNTGWYIAGGIIFFIIILAILYKMGYIKPRNKSKNAMINPRR